MFHQVYLSSNLFAVFAGFSFAAGIFGDLRQRIAAVRIVSQHELEKEKRSPGIQLSLEAVGPTARRPRPFS